MNLNVFGEVNPSITEYVVFHDESECHRSKYYYHGFLLVKQSELKSTLDELLKIKIDNYELEKEIHFSDIRGDANSENGEKAKVATLWLQKCKEWLFDNKIKFYLLGVNKNNLKNFWKNKMSYDLNTYVRFFEIGLYGAVRWFAEGEKHRIMKELCITQLYFDPKDRVSDQKRMAKTLKLSRILREANKIGIIKGDRALPLDSDSKISGLNISNFIQLADVLIGVCRVSFVKISKRGQQECLNEFIKVIEGFNCSAKAYRRNAPYYKKFALSFFPKRNNLTRKEFLRKGTERNNFYCDRPTYREEKDLKKQQCLF